MPSTGIFFIPATATTTADDPLSHEIFRALARQHSLDPLPNWSLEHRLFRETIPSNDGAKSGDKRTRSRALQLISLSHRPGNTYLAITDTYSATPGGLETAKDPATIISIPTTSIDEFLTMTLRRLHPLWSQRQILQVTKAQGFEVGEFTIRFGEVKQAQGGTQQIKGTIIEIEWIGGDDQAEEVIKGFWSDLDFPGAKEFIQVTDADTKFKNVQQWCDAMRLRS